MKPILTRMGELDPDIGASLAAHGLEGGELQDAPGLRAALGRLDDLDDLFALLPDAEAPGRVPRYAAITLLETEDGYVVHRYPKEASILVSMFGVRASSAIVQEMALLKAAEVALEKGETQMLVTEREAARQSDAHTFYGTVLSTSPNGHRTYVRVEFADQRRAEAASAWRGMDPAVVRATLAPTYIRPRKKR